MSRSRAESAPTAYYADTAEIDVRALDRGSAAPESALRSDRPTVGGDNTRPQDTFADTERFRVVRALGAGGMGSVYEVEDLKASRRVALKTLLRWGAYELYLFKQEFRRLRDVVHPNLVHLEELFAEEDRWYFTMDLVPGRTLLEWIAESAGGQSSVQRGSGGEQADIIETLGLELPSTLEPGDGLQTAPHLVLPDPGKRVDRVRQVFPQIVEGVRALHQVGIVHRDLKPTNVIVTPDARAVVLDFGLAVELQSAPGPSSGRGRLFGTIAYMSPEQAQGLPPTGASDWYAVGVMLYEALTGVLPHRGTPTDVLHGKLNEDPVDLTVLAPLAPEDLCALTMDLLQREPERRPNGAEILSRLGLTTPDNAAASSTGGFQTTHRLALELGAKEHAGVGREGPMRVLRGALARARGRESQVVCVTGASGMGKSALLDAFADAARKDGATVLRARCFERESVPFKALDPLIDELAARLRAAGTQFAREMCPRHVGSLLRAFPVLGGIEGFEAPIDKASEVVDPVEQRRRAIAAVREFFDRLATREPLLVIVDDLQWGDPDSAHLLSEVLRKPDSPPFCLVLAWRAETSAEHPVLQRLGPAQQAAERPEDWALVELGPLSPSEAERVAALRLESKGVRKRGLASVIARESGGVPLFIEELVRFARAEGAEDAARQMGDLHLQDLLRRRVEALPDQARHLLEVLCVAGDARPRAVIEDAVGPMVDPKALLVLTAEQFVVLWQTPSGQNLAPFHDKVREAVSESLAPARMTQIHLALARTIGRYQPEDDEALAGHFYEGGATAEALHHGKIAAANAARQFAFDRAASLYERCLSLCDDPQERATLLFARAEALAHGGMGIAAADAYLDLATSSAPERRRVLEQRAAAQLVRAGAIERGRDVLERVLHDAGLPMPASNLQAILSFLWHRLRVTLRGLNFAERSPESVDSALLERVDLSWAVSLGLSLIDAVRGADYQARNLLFALQAGEPYRVARSFAAEAAYAAAFGGRGTARAERLVQLAGALAARVGHPHAQGMWRLCSGIVHFQRGRFDACYSDSKEAVSIFLTRCTDVAWELSTSWIYLMAVRLFLGRFDEFLRDHPALVAAARERADLHSEIHIHLAMPIPHAALIDDAEGGRRGAQEAWARWPDQTFSLLTLHAWRTLAELALYSLDDAEALKPAEDGWQALRKSPLNGVVVVRYQTLDLRLRALLGKLQLGAPSSEILPDVRKGCVELRKSGIPWFQACATLLHAQCVAAEQPGDEAARQFVLASVELDAAGLHPHAAAARFRAAQHGATTFTVAGSLKPLADAGVVHPARLARMLAPFGALP